MREVFQAFRSLARDLRFTSIALICLGLGIGAATLIYSVATSVLLHPLPVSHLREIQTLWDVHVEPGSEPEQLPVSPANFAAWQERNQVFESMAALEVKSFNLTGTDEPELLKGSRVSANSFSVLGVQPLLGRTFARQEDQPGRGAVVLIGKGLWQRRFGSDPGVLGRSVTLDGRPYQVIGVMPAGFRFPEDAEIWIPFSLAEERTQERWNWHFLYALAIPKSGISQERIQSEMEAVAGHLQRERPDTNAGWSVKAIPFTDHLVGDLRLVLLILTAAVGVLLLITCANVSNLFLVRSLRQFQDLTLRAALGAGRFQLVRQVLAESILLSLLGGACGLLLASWALKPLVAMSPAKVSTFETITLDFRALGFALLVSLITGILLGLVPAVRLSRPDIYTVFKSGRSRSGASGLQERRFQGLLVVSEVALALILLIGAGLMIKSFQKLQTVPTGFEPEHRLAMRITFPGSKYTEPAPRISVIEQLLESTRALPGVQSADITSNLPVADSAFNLLARLSIEDRPPETSSEVLVLNYRMVSHGYFRTMGIPLLQGRAFTEQDRSDAQGVVVVSERMARLYWPGANPVGKRIKRGLYDSTNPWLTVVGVVGDVKDAALDLEPAPTVYLPYSQNPTRTVSLVLRTESDPALLTSAVRGAVRKIDPDAPLYNVATVEQILADSLVRQRFSAFVLATFSLFGLVLAVVGVYGVMSYTVSRQQHEVAVRMALGAQGRDIIRMYMRQGILLTLLGLTIGVAVAFALNQLIVRLLHDVSSTDPEIFLGISCTLAAVALLASYLPARRATKIDPVVFMRSS